MDVINFLLGLIAVLLFMIWNNTSAISKRMREHFPTDEEEDHDWALKDPAGHYAAHKDDKK
jgi:hypothetical protein